MEGPGFAPRPGRSLLRITPSQALPAVMSSLGVNVVEGKAARKRTGQWSLLSYAVAENRSVAHAARPYGPSCLGLRDYLIFLLGALRECSLKIKNILMARCRKTLWMFVMQACKGFNDDGNCVPHCPPPFIYSNKENKNIPNTNVKYIFGTLCVNECPGEYTLQFHCNCRLI